MKKRLWVVSELYYPDAQATSRILTTLAEGLAAEFEVRVLCAYPTMQFDPPQTATGSDQRHGVAIRRFLSTRMDKAVLLFRLVNLLTISVPVFFHLLFNLRRGDAVLVVTNPPVMPFVAAAAGVARSARVIVLTHDVYPDVLVPTGILQRADLLFRLLQRTARWLYRHADGVVVLGRDMEKRVRSYVDAGSLPVRIIPNWGEPDRMTVMPRSVNSILADHGISRKFVMLYAGTMGRTHGIEDVLACAEACSGLPDVHFLFAGVGVKRTLVERYVSRHRPDNVTLLPFVDARLQCELLNACDVAVIAMIEGMQGISVPSRMYNTMAVGKPIIAITEPDSELAYVVAEERIGWIVPPGNVAALKQAIEAAKADPDELAAKSRRAREVAESRYTAPKAIRQFRSFLAEVGS